MSERDDLAELIGGVSPQAARATADDVLDAGYRKPRTVTGAQKLDALAVGSAVQTSDTSDVVVLKCGTTTFRNQDGYEISGDDLWRYGTHPLTVLYEPPA